MKTVVEVSTGITVQTNCYDCEQLRQDDDNPDDAKCSACLETQEAREDELAWNHRADERLSEGDVITDLSEQPVASDWIASHTLLPDGRIRDEFKPSTYNLEDRCPSTYLLGQHLFDLDEDEQRSVLHFYEMVCPKCHLVYPKRTGCLDCK